mgnify:CR=1 FL=1
MARKPPKGKSLAEKNPELAKQWHPTGNGDLTPFDVVNFKLSVRWKCNKSGYSWEAEIKDELSRCKCNVCEELGVKHPSLPTCETLDVKYPELAKQLHPKEKTGLNEGRTYFVSGLHQHHNNRSTWWKCDKVDDHEWQDSITNRIKKGAWCQVCHHPYNLYLQHLEKEELEAVNNSARIIKKIHERYSLLNSFDYEEFCSNLDFIAFPFMPHSHKMQSRSDRPHDHIPVHMGFRILYKAPKKKLNQIKKLFIKEHHDLKEKFYKFNHIIYKDKKYLDDEQKKILNDFFLNNHKKSWYNYNMTLQHLLHNQLFEDLLEYEYDYRYGNLAFKCVNTNTIFYSALPFAFKQKIVSISPYVGKPNHVDVENFYDNTQIKFYDQNSGFEYDNVFHKLNDFESTHKKFFSNMKENAFREGLKNQPIIGLNGSETKNQIKAQMDWDNRHTRI